MAKPTISSGQKSFVEGYTDDKRNASVNKLVPPSVNMNITHTGEAVNRPGSIDTGIDLSETGKSSKTLYIEEFDVTFFAIGTKVKYYEWENNVIYDTGITLTDSDTITSRFTEYNGVVYVTNSTDGCYGFLLTRLNGAVSNGAANIVTDISGAAVASAFDTELSPGTKNLRIEGTDEQYASITVSTGTFVLSGTASQAYGDNDIAIVVYDLTAVIPKASKLVPWKESLNAIGISVDDGVGAGDRSQTTMYFSQFATAATSEASVTWSGGTAGSELVGKSGTVKNILATRDYLYIFKEKETYFISVSDVNSATGSRPPQLLSKVYGCVNEDLAADMGNGTVAFLTNNNRIIAIRISTETGAPVVFPDTEFDNDIQNLLQNLDKDQSNSIMYYCEADDRLFVEVDISGVKARLKFNNKIQAWEPPDTGVSSRDYFERKGVCYRTILGEDTILESGVGHEDEGVEIDFVGAHTLIEFEDGRTTLNLSETEISGSMGEDTTITYENIVSEGSPQTKTFNSTGISFDLANSLGSVTLGETTLGASSGVVQLGDWDKRFGINPTYGTSYQGVISSTKPFTWKSYRIKVSALSDPLSTLT